MGWSFPAASLCRPRFIWEELIPVGVGGSWEEEAEAGGVVTSSALTSVPEPLSPWTAAAGS